jgi:tartrate/fumarate subfamily iron-sulfur-dependent hydro-lyase beta chain
MPFSREIRLPFDVATLRDLVLGESLLLTGVVHTARDAAHQLLASGAALAPGLDLHEALLYHCGPVIIRDDSGAWRVTAAGPTTSSREEPYMAAIIGRFQLRGIIGKGGMGAATAQACREHGCVYLHAVGGAAQVLADCVEEIPAVYYLEEFGAPEAIWVMRVRRFPVVVTMDAHGNSLHQQVQENSRQKLRELGLN